MFIAWILVDIGCVDAAEEEVIAMELSATGASSWLSGTMRGSAFLGDLDQDGVAGEMAWGMVDNPITLYIAWFQPATGRVTKAVPLANGVNGIPPGHIGTGTVFGQSISFLGDLDGDGQAAELAVGADTDGGGKGAIHILWLVPATGHAARIIRLENGHRGVPASTFRAYAGRSNAFLGDFDGDGHAAEIAAGAHGTHAPGTDENAGGFFLIYLNHTTGHAKKVVEIAPGTGGMPLDALGVQFNFGEGLAPVPTTPAGGTGWIAAGAPSFNSNQGTVFLVEVDRISGAYQGMINLVTNTTVGLPGGSVPSSTRFGAALVTLGDIAGTGQVSLAVGAGIRKWVYVVTLEARRVAVASHWRLGDSLAGIAPGTIGSARFGTFMAAFGCPYPRRCVNGSTAILVDQFLVRLRSPPRPPLAQRSLADTELIDSEGADMVDIQPGIEWGWLSTLRAQAGSEEHLLTGTAARPAWVLAPPQVSLGGAEEALFDTGFELITARYHHGTSVSEASTWLDKDSLPANWVEADTGDGIGTALARVGDSTGAGCGWDVAIGAPGRDALDRTNAGAVYIVHQPCTGDLRKRKLVMRATSDDLDGSILPAEAELGHSVVWVGTVEAAIARHTTVVAGAPGVGAGSLFVLRFDYPYSATTPSVKLVQRLLAGAGMLPTLPGGARLGASLAVVHATRHTAVGLFAGAPGANEVVAIGSFDLATGKVDEPTLSIGALLPEGTLSADDAFGSAVLARPWQSGRGYELFVGAPGDNTGETAAGAVYALQIPTLIRPASAALLAWSKLAAGSVGLKAQPFATQHRFGSALAWIGDLDGNGSSETLAVGGASTVHVLWLGWTGANNGSESARLVKHRSILTAGRRGVPTSLPEGFGSSLMTVGNWSWGTGGRGGGSQGLLVGTAAAGAGGALLLRLRGNASVETPEELMPAMALDSVVPNASLPFASVSTLRLLGRGLAAWDPFLGAATASLLPPRLRLTGGEPRYCTVNSSSVASDGSSLECSLSPSLDLNRTISLAVAGTWSDQVSLQFDLNPRIAAVDQQGDLPRDGQVPRTFSGNDLFPSGQFSRAQLQAVGAGALLIGEDYHCGLPDVGLSEDGTSITCNRMPGGVGGPHPVRLVLPGGRLSESAATVVYEPARVSAISPSSVRLTKLRLLSFNITGSKFGASPADVSRVVIGGNDCRNVSWMSSSELRCLGVSGAFTDHNVIVYTGTLGSTGGAALLEFPELPRILAVSPQVVPTAGNATLTCYGTDLVEQLGTIVRLDVGHEPCANVRAVGSNLLCEAPAGTGAGLHMSIVTTGGFRVPSDLPVVSYQQPSVHSCEPATAFSNAKVSYNFTVLGSGFGVVDAGQVEALSIGGQPCRRVVHQGDSKLRCIGATPPWSNTDRTVRVVVRGQAASAAVIDFQAPPSVSELVPSTVPTLGGAVSIAGSGFGGSADDIVAIRIADALCGDVEYVSSSSLRCNVPPGVGAGLQVVVEVALNGASDPQPLLSYAAPVPAEVGVAGSPAGPSAEQAAVYAGEADVNLELGLSNVGSSVKLLTLQLQQQGGDWAANCANLTRSDGGIDGEDQVTRVACHGVSLARFPSEGGRMEPVLSVQGQASVGAGISWLVIGRPVISILSQTADIPTAGFGNSSHAPLQVLGSDLGMRPEDLVSVTVGGRECPTRWISEDEVRIAVPPGVGADQRVRVVTRGGLADESRRTVSYRPAEVLALTPSYSLTGTGSASFNITGTDFGNQATDLTSIAVGGRACREAVWLSPSLVRCINASRSGWRSHSVTVTVGGQDGLRNSYFDAVGPPSVAVVSPAVAGAGADLLILGDNFGSVPSDVLSVAINGEPCFKVVHRGPTALSCTMPEQPPAVQAAFARDPTVLRNVPVVVTTAGGQRSAPAAVSYSGSGEPLRQAPTHLLAWRPVGQADSFVLRWVFPTDEQMQDVDNVTSFDVELAQLNASSDPQQFSVRVADMQASGDIAQTREGLQVFKYGDFVFTGLPVTVRVRAVNPTGDGPWSDFTPPVPANCAKAAFLQTHTAASAWQCGACPVGAFCGGAASPHVTARDGYWRVPWSHAGLGFAECPRRASCLGYQANAANGSVASASMPEAASAAAHRRLGTLPSLASVLAHARHQPTPATHPDAWGDPVTMESCDVGYFGTMCAACVPGYTRWGSFGCRKCKSAAVVALAMVGLGVLVFLVVGYLIVSAIKSGAEKTPLGTAAIKVAFSHIQTVAIAASFNLEWPDSVLSLFAGMSTATSVSSEVLSLDCALPSDGNEASASDGQSRFFDKAAIVLAMPLLMLAAAATFWLACSLRLRQVPGRSSSPRRAQPALQGTENPIVATAAGRDRGSSLAGASALPGRGPSFHRLVQQRLSLSHKHIGVSLSVWDKWLTSAVVVLFLVHMSVTTTSLQLLTCRDVDAPPSAVLDGGTVPAAVPGLQQAEDRGCDADQTHRRLVQDLEVCCFDRRALANMYGLGVPGLLVYAFGIPIAGALLLWHRRDSLHTHHTKTTLGFLYAGFKDEAYYWESVVMLRKVGVATVAVALEPMGVTLQTYTALLLIAILLVLHARVWPYHKGLLNRLELAALGTSFLTFECGLFLTDPATSRPVRVLATLIIFVSNICFLGMAVAVILWDKLGLRQGRSRRKTATLTRSPSPALPLPDAPSQ